MTHRSRAAADRNSRFAPPERSCVLRDRGSASHKVNRTFIREALEAAIAGLDLEDAERTEIDQDTKGVLGSPVVADTIFKKIKAAAVVVADVTLTARTAAGKPVSNSNVAIELGYARVNEQNESSELCTLVRVGIRTGFSFLMPEQHLDRSPQNTATQLVGHRNHPSIVHSPARNP